MKTMTMQKKKELQCRTGLLYQTTKIQYKSNFGERQN